MEIINKLNKKMVEFYSAWEKENTEETFITLSAEYATTTELQLNIDKYEGMVKVVEDILNDENNFDSITDNWDSIDLKLLDILISTFEIEIEEFVKMIETKEVRKDIKEFILER